MTKREEQKRIWLSGSKLEELGYQLSVELNAIYPDYHPEKHLQEQRILLLKAQVDALIEYSRTLTSK